MCVVIFNEHNGHTGFYFKLALILYMSQLLIPIIYQPKRDLNMDVIDEYYELSDEDKREVFYLFNPDEPCDFTTKEYCYSEFWERNEKFCQVCYSEIAEEIKTHSDEHQNRLMQSLAKKQKDAFKDRVFHTYFPHKYCNHKYCSECNGKIELKQDYVLVNPNNKQHLFSNVKQNYFVCSCNDFIYLPVVEKDVFLEQLQTSEDNTERDILSLDRIKMGYSLLKNALYHDVNTKIIRVNKIDIQDRIWVLSDHIPLKCKEKHPKLKAPNWNKIENMIRGYYEIWVKLNRNYSILDSLTPKTHSFQYAGDPLRWGLVSNMETIHNENPVFWFDYRKRIYTDIVIDICNLMDKRTNNDTVSFSFYINYGHLKGTDITKQIEVLLEPYHNDKNIPHDFKPLKALRDQLLTHTDLDYLPTKNADELFSELQNLHIDLQLIHNFLKILSRFFETISKYYELRIDFKLNEITTTMHSDLLIGDINNVLCRLDIYPVQKYTAHKRIEFDITKECIDKCYKEKNKVDTVKNMVKNNNIHYKENKWYFINDKNETGLDNHELKDLINKYIIPWRETDNGIKISICPDDPEIIDPLVVSLNNSPILKESLNAHILLFRYSNGDMGIIQELRNVGKPAYTITEELIQWIEDFYADKKVNPITCFIKHQGVDNFTGANASNGTVGIVE